MSLLLERAEQLIFVVESWYIKPLYVPTSFMVMTAEPILVTDKSAYQIAYGST